MDGLSSARGLHMRERSDKLLCIGLEEQERLWQAAYGEPIPLGIESRRRGIRFAIEQLTAAVWVDHVELIRNHYSWTLGMLANRGVPPQSVRLSFEALREASRQALDSDAAAVAVDFIDDAIASGTPSSSIAECATRDTLLWTAESYLERVLVGDRRGAADLVLAAREAGASQLQVFVDVLQSVQQRIGELWYANEISSADEHVASAITEWLLTLLTSGASDTVSARSEPRMIGVSVGEELHELALRMVCDIFEEQGWASRFVGGNLPRAALADAVRDYQPDVIALSATMAYRIPDLALAIESIRDRASGPAPWILVGGYAFDAVPGLWEEIGADQYLCSLEDVAQQAAGELRSNVR